MQWQEQNPPLDPKTSSKLDTSSEPEASLECVADPEGVPISMRSSPDRVSLVVCKAREGVIVTGCTY